MEKQITLRVKVSEGRRNALRMAAAQAGATLQDIIAHLCGQDHLDRAVREIKRKAVA